jgi:hypothetical protein
VERLLERLRNPYSMHREGRTRLVDLRNRQLFLFFFSQTVGQVLLITFEEPLHFFGLLLCPLRDAFAGTVLMEVSKGEDFTLLKVLSNRRQQRFENEIRYFRRRVAKAWKCSVPPTRNRLETYCHRRVMASARDILFPCVAPAQCQPATMTAGLTRMDPAMVEDHVKRKRSVPLCSGVQHVHHFVRPCRAFFRRLPVSLHCFLLRRVGPIEKKYMCLKCFGKDSRACDMIVT